MEVENPEVIDSVEISNKNDDVGDDEIGSYASEHINKNESNNEPDDIDAPEDCQEKDWENHTRTSTHPFYTDLDYFSSAVLQDLLHESETSKLNMFQRVKVLQESLQQQKIEFEDIKMALNLRCDDAYKIIQSLEEKIQIDKENATNNLIEMQIKLDQLKDDFQQKEQAYLTQITSWEMKKDSYDDFQLKKDYYEAQIQQTITSTEEEKTRLQKQYKDLEIESIMNRATLRKQFEVKMAQHAATIEETVQNRLSTEYKEFYDDYKRIKHELVLQSGDSIRILMGRHQDTLDKTQRTQIELDLIKSTTAMNTEKVVNLQNTIKQLQKELINEKMIKKNLKIELNRKIERKNDLIRTLEQEVASLKGYYNDNSNNSVATIDEDDEEGSAILSASKTSKDRSHRMSNNKGETAVLHSYNRNSDNNNIYSRRNHNDDDVDDNNYYNDDDYDEDMWSYLQYCYEHYLKQSLSLSLENQNDVFDNNNNNNNNNNNSNNNNNNADDNDDNNGNNNEGDDGNDNMQVSVQESSSLEIKSALLATQGGNSWERLNRREQEQLLLKIVHKVVNKYPQKFFKKLHALTQQLQSSSSSSISKNTSNNNKMNITKGSITPFYSYSSSSTSTSLMVLNEVSVADSDTGLSAQTSQTFELYGGDSDNNNNNNVGNGNKKDDVSHDHFKFGSSSIDSINSTLNSTSIHSSSNSHSNQHNKLSLKLSPFTLHHHQRNNVSQNKTSSSPLQSPTYLGPVQTTATSANDNYVIKDLYLQQYLSSSMNGSLPKLRKIKKKGKTYYISQPVITPTMMPVEPSDYIDRSTTTPVTLESSISSSLLFTPMTDSPPPSATTATAAVTSTTFTQQTNISNNNNNNNTSAAADTVNSFGGTEVEAATTSIWSEEEIEETIVAVEKNPYLLLLPRKEIDNPLMTTGSISMSSARNSSIYYQQHLRRNPPPSVAAVEQQQQLSYAEKISNSNKSPSLSSPQHYQRHHHPRNLQQQQQQQRDEIQALVADVTLSLNCKSMNLKPLQKQHNSNNNNRYQSPPNQSSLH